MNVMVKRVVSVVVVVVVAVLIVSVVGFVAVPVAFLQIRRKDKFQ